MSAPVDPDADEMGAFVRDMALYAALVILMLAAIVAVELHHVAAHAAPIAAALPQHD